MQSSNKCPHNKVDYPSKSEALIAASRIVKPVKRKGGSSKPFKMRAYRCDDCDQWHLTKRVRG